MADDVRGGEVPGDAAAAARGPSGGGGAVSRWWSHPDGPTGHGPGFGLPAGRPAPGAANQPLRPEPGPRPGSGSGSAPGSASGPFPGPLQAPGRRGEGRTGRPSARVAAGALAVVLCAGVLGGGVGALVQGARQGGRITLHPVPGASRQLRPDSTADIVQAALPGVVYLHVSDGSNSVTGTGIVLDGKGHILTNNHVVAPFGRPGQVTVVFSSGQQHAAALVGRDASADLAVIQVDGVTGLHPLALGSASALRVGDPVLAIGAPFGLRATVTSGIVSSLDRPVTMGGGDAGPGPAYLDALQTDAAINPGNSGGPLLDSSGAVVGVNTAIRSADPGTADPDGVSDQAGSDGVGFAIPIDQAMRVAEQLIDGVRVEHTALGVTLDRGYQGGGLVLSVTPAALGLRPGDVLTGLDGTPVNSADDLIALVRGRVPGSVAQLTVVRAGVPVTVRVRLHAAPGDPAAGAA